MWNVECITKPPRWELVIGFWKLDFGNWIFPLPITASLLPAYGLIATSKAPVINARTHQI